MNKCLYKQRLHRAELQAGEGQGGVWGHSRWQEPQLITDIAARATVLGAATAAHNLGAAIPKTGVPESGPLGPPPGPRCCPPTLIPGQAPKLPEAAQGASPAPPQALASADSSQRDKLPAQPKVGETQHSLP